MKKLVLLAGIALALCAAAGAQTWTVYNNSDCDFEYTVISKEQFERLRKAHETSDASVMISYVDNAEGSTGGGGKVIKGTKPTLQGYSYLLVRMVNLSQKMREAASKITCSLSYGHSERGEVTLVFLNADVIEGDGFISLRYNRSGYEWRYNQFTALVEGR